MSDRTGGPVLGRKALMRMVRSEASSVDAAEFRLRLLTSYRPAAIATLDVQSLLPHAQRG